MSTSEDRWLEAKETAREILYIERVELNEEDDDEWIEE